MPDDEMNIQFPPNMPEEMKDLVRMQIQRQMMLHDDARLRFDRFWTELSVENLREFSSMMSRAQQIPTYVPYLEGYADAILERIHKVCPECGKSHEEDLEAALAAHTAQADHPEHPAAQAPKPPMSNADLAKAWNGPDSEEVVLDPRCSTCHGDRAIKVCNHPAGSHGQLVGGAVCPEPLLVPCPECLCPEWYTFNTLADSPCHPVTSLLPIETRDRGVCAECGQEWAYPVPAEG